MPMAIRHHGRPNGSALRLPSSSTQHNSTVAAILDGLGTQIRLNNLYLRENHGVEIDFHIAGSYALYAWLRQRSHESNLFIPNDLDIFVGIRIVDEEKFNERDDTFINIRETPDGFSELEAYKLQIINGRVTHMIGSVFHAFPASSYSSSRLSGLLHRRDATSESSYNTLPDVFSCYRLNMENANIPDVGTVLPNLNIIFRRDLIGNGFDENLTTLFDSFDLSLTKAAISITNTRGRPHQIFMSVDDSFRESIQQRVCDFTLEPPTGDRKQKYEERLRAMGFDWTW